MTDTGATADARQQVSMSGEQFQTLMSTLLAGVHQTSVPLSTGQQAVALRFRLLRNGLGRFQSPSEGYDRALIRMHQIQRYGGSRLVIEDPIPPEAASMVVVVKGRRTRHGIPEFVYDGKCVHPVDESVVIELVEFLDRFQVPIAAGVPVQLEGDDDDPRAEVPGAQSETVVDEGNGGPSRPTRRNPQRS